MATMRLLGILQKLVLCRHAINVEDDCRLGLSQLKKRIGTFWIHVIRLSGETDLVNEMYVVLVIINAVKSFQAKFRKFSCLNAKCMFNVEKKKPQLLVLCEQYY